ncbi:MAG: c-type cytochrome [Gemmatimonadetes bacterium]|nr:c-type cytochrome [Gemmatimonadota bacterium]NIO31328.1 c-type cytochrome [Gemmatimonadota bacterium]
MLTALYTRNTRTLWFAAFAVFCCASLSGAGAAHAQSDRSFPGDPIAGRRIFVARACDRCHAIWGNGGTLGPDFALVGAGRSLQQLAGMFWNHTPQMIQTVQVRGFQWPTFSEEELADIISYIYYVKLFDEPGDPVLGERWFRELRCIECHAIGGEGGRIAPPLDSYARYIAPLMLATGMWNHGSGMQAQQGELREPIPSFRGREMADIQAYIRQVSSLRDRDVTFLQPPDPNTGRALFRAKGCIGCHGPRGGGTQFGPDLRSATEQLRVSEIAGTLWNHSSQMAAAMRARGITFPRFQGKEMADIIAFLYYLRFYDTGGDARAGEAVFAQKGCASCHAVDGGASIGPDLSQSEAILAPIRLATAMWNHAPAMYAVIQLEHIDWPRFEGVEMRDLAVYLSDLAASK